MRMKTAIENGVLKVEIPLEGITIRRNVINVRGRKPNGLFDYEIVPMSVEMEEITKNLLSDPGRTYLKVKCGDKRMENISILLSCLLYNASGPAHTIAGGSGIPSRLISELSHLPEGEGKEKFLGEIETVAKSSWINYAKFAKIFKCNGGIFLEHSDCHGWSNVIFKSPEEENDMHLQAAILLASQKGEQFKEIDEFFAVYVQFNGEKVISIDIYYFVFS